MRLSILEILWGGESLVRRRLREVFVQLGMWRLTCATCPGHCCALVQSAKCVCGVSLGSTESRSGRLTLVKPQKRWTSTLNEFGDSVKSSSSSS